MTKARFSAAVTASILAFAAAAEAKTPPPLAKSNNAFAVDLYRKLADDKGNVFASPSSIHTALAMTYAGARGRTASQMAKTLSLPADKAGSTWPQERVHPEYARLLEALRPGDKGYQLHVANALWGQKGYPWLREFLAATSGNYGAGLRQVNFTTDAEGARKRINQWVEDQTKEKIKDLIASGVLNTMTRLVLTNAIYFKGKWVSPFEKRATHMAPFKLSPGKTKTVPMMHQRAKLGYCQDAGVQVLSMPYAGDDLAMMVVLPKKVDGLAGVERTLTAAKLEKWSRQARKQQVKVYLPKFKLTCEFRLADVLKALGMTDAFSPGAADFSGMNGKRDLFISAVIHKAFVDVNEEGTEAAAATAVVVQLTSAGPIKRVPVFRADHPFMFVIRHVETGAVLFMGRIRSPEGGRMPKAGPGTGSRRGGSRP